MPAVATASAPWSSAAADAAAWRFARPMGAGWRFDLRRNVSMTPRQFGLAFALLALVSLLVALLFWVQGARFVLLFTGIELAAVGAACLFAARHVGDRDVVTFAGREVHVEQHVGPAVQQSAFRLDWLRVEPSTKDGSLVELSGEGRRVRIGRHVRPELRNELARELRRVVQMMRRPAAPARANEHESR